MNIQDLENELIELAKQNPTEDYYVGDVGRAIRDILKRWMGKRYPSRKIDPPRKPEKRPDDEIGGMLWDEGERIMEKISLESRTRHMNNPWLKLRKKGKFPKNISTCTYDRTLPQ